MANPYVLDCSLAGRTFCDSVRIACQEFIITDTDDITITEEKNAIYPNPNNGSEIIVDLSSAFIQKELDIQIYNMQGTSILQQKTNLGEPRISILPATRLPSGMYMVLISNGEEVSFHRLIVI